MKDKNVLIIEDSITYQQALKRAFVDQGAACVCTMSGEKGLEALKSYVPDLIIMDLILPGISGKEVCQQIKSNLNYRHIPVMMLSMQREEKEIGKSFDAGADSYVSKSDDLDLIIRRARALIKLSAVVAPILKDELSVQEEEIDLKDQKILIVDDDITYLQALKRGLEALNYKVTTAQSGEECFVKIQENFPDLILLDLRMPDINGTDVCRKLRMIRKLQHIPVVMLTASDAQDDVVRSFESGVTDYVIKSGDFKLIHLRINSILRRKHFEKFSTELQRSNRDLEQFAFAVSHDLQTPLRQMIAFLNLLNITYKGKLDARADEFITAIANSGARMQTLIDGLLQFAKLDSSGHEKEHVAITAIVENALKNLDILIKENNVVIAYDRLPELDVNKTATTQLFQNLIQNAIKYRDKERQPYIEISAEEQDNAYEFAVKDNGIGIDPIHSTKVFQMFQRLHAQDQYSGIGLGLAMCEKYVKIHGGRIWVESKQGEGCTFKFTIPISRA